MPTPHGDDHVVWINPDNPKIFIETNDGGANITQDNGKSWSTQMNQPTAEFYMVDADEQFPYRIYGPQQDNSTVYVANVPPFSWPPDQPTQTWFQASGCESGQIRPTPDGKIIYGDCKGEFGRYNVETGQEQHYWIYPQQRYGKNPKDMRYRFVRQAPIEVDAHNPKIVYHGSQYVHKTIDGGMHWTRFSPDVTANRPEGHVTSGEPITRDMTGEEVYAALYSMRSSRLEPGVFWTGSNDGPVWMTRDGGKTWKNVTPADLPPGGRVHTIEDSPHRRGSAYVSVYRMYLNDFKPYLYMTNDYGAALDAADRRHQRHPGRPADARRARGSGAGRAAVRRHARGRVRVVRSGQALADAAAEPAGDAGHRFQGPPRRSRRVDDGAVVLDHGQRRAAAPDRGERDEAVASADDGQSERAGRAGS